MDEETAAYKRYDSGMQRAIVRITVFMLLGAVVNVAAAWACAYWIELDRSVQRYDSFDSYGLAFDDPQGERFPGYAADRHQDAGVEHVSLRYTHGGSRLVPATTISFEEIIPHWAEKFLDIPELNGRDRQPLDETITHLAYVDARGWPCLALWGGLKIPRRNLSLWDDGEPVTLLERRHGVIMLQEPDPKGGRRFYRWLPLVPVWRGFVINTLFYAAILWMLFCMPGKVRRAIRRRRGRCPACAYPMGDSPVCTECGAAIGANRKQPRS